MSIEQDIRPQEIVQPLQLMPRDEFLRAAGSFDPAVDMRWAAACMQADTVEPNQVIDGLVKALKIAQEYPAASTPEARENKALDFYDSLGIEETIRNQRTLPTPAAFMKTARSLALLKINPVKVLEQNPFATIATPEQWYDAYETTLIHSADAQEATAAITQHSSAVMLPADIVKDSFTRATYSDVHVSSSEVLRSAHDTYSQRQVKQAKAAKRGRHIVLSDTVEKPAKVEKVIELIPEAEEWLKSERGVEFIRITEKYGLPTRKLVESLSFSRKIPSGRVNHGFDNIVPSKFETSMAEVVTFFGNEDAAVTYVQKDISYVASSKSEALINKLKELRDGLQDLGISKDDALKLLSVNSIRSYEYGFAKLRKFKDLVGNESFSTYSNDPILIKVLASTKAARTDAVLSVLEACTGELGGQKNLGSVFICGPAIALYALREILINTGKQPSYAELISQANKLVSEGLKSADAQAALNNQENSVAILEPSFATYRAYMSEVNPVEPSAQELEG